MMGYTAVTADDIAAFEGIMPGRVLTGSAILDDYCHDEMGEYGHFTPEAVLQCQSTQEISQVMCHCAARRIPVTPRGAGTGLCGGCVAKDGGVVLSLERMNRILEIDKINMTATVEPGVLLMNFAKELSGTGLFYPPDPGEKSATMGGNAMTNAGGMRAVRYGVTRDYVIGMEVVLPSGEVIELGGKIAKNSSGYSLLHLMIGSEGTLGILTKLTVRIVPEPKENLSILVPFDDLTKCIDAVPKVLLSGAAPTAVEFMEKEVIAASEAYLGKQFPDTSASAYLLIRLDGASNDALMQTLNELVLLLVPLGAKDVLLADTDERKASLWDARGAFLEAIKGSTPSMDECDVVVPREHIATFLTACVALSGDLALRVRSFGHAGDGNLHIYACKDDMDDATWQPKCQAFMDALYEKARELGGQVSGEHGIGHAKVPFLREAVGDVQMGLMQGIKRAFDPDRILNPGKVVGL